jgi:tetratricopeptide (TPR) repeat protein
MNRSKLVTMFLAVAVAAGAMNGCTKPADDGKIPVTTKSDEGRKEYMQGRDLTDRLQTHEANGHFDKAIAADPEFAMAYLLRANGAASTTEFLEYVAKAVSHAGTASEGERLVILAAEAASVADAPKRKELLDKLVAAYPKDERAHEFLGIYHQTQQEYPDAVGHFKAATDLAPAYAPVYNTLGYTYRAMEKYPEAEQAFKKYTELLPGDPNPYDSYAELLLKEGKFDESIENYKMALAKDPGFISSKQGIAFNHLYMGQPDQAVDELRSMMSSARDESERGQARLDLIVLYLDGGNTTMALQYIDSGYAESEKRNDIIDMAQGIEFKGVVLEEAGNYAAARELYDREMKMIDSSNLSADRKEPFVRGSHYHAATLAMAANKISDAKAHAAEYEKLVSARPTPGRQRVMHELNGRIALSAKEYDRAIEELGKANREDAYNLYRLALAYSGKGDAAKAKEHCAKAAHFYALPDANYAFIRLKAGKMLAGMKG